MVVLAFEGHAPKMVGIARLDQQGSVDLGGRWLGPGVDDVLAGRDVAVDAQHVEDQTHVLGPPAGADRVGLAGGVERRRERRADGVLWHQPRSCARGPQEVEALHPVDLGQVFFQPAVVDPEDRQLHHRQNWLGAGGGVLGGWLLVVEMALHLSPRERFGRVGVDDDSPHGGLIKYSRKTAAF